MGIMGNVTRLPICPICGSKMRLIEPKDTDDWDEFYGCTEYPDCTGSRNISPLTGEIETDEEATDRLLRRGDYELDCLDDDIWDWD